jgi:hypothetical protein
VTALPRFSAACFLALSLSLARAEGAAPPEKAASPIASPEDGNGEWRASRWGMTAEEVLRAFPGEARRLDPQEKLLDGNVVAVGIEHHELAWQDFRVRFVFENGKLALVSLRTPPDAYAKPEVFERVRAHLDEAFGRKGEYTSDENFIDMRQVRWRLPRGSVDLKFIPGVVVILYYRPGVKPAGR